VAELEVPTLRACRRHDLRAMDADAEAAAKKWSPFRGRRLEGGRAHDRRGAVRGGRGGREGQTRGFPSPAARRRTGAGCFGSSHSTAPAPPLARQRSRDSRTASDRGSSRRQRQAGACGGTSPAKAAATFVRIRGPRRGARTASRSHPGDGSPAAGRRASPRELVRTHEPPGSRRRPPSPARNLGREDSSPFMGVARRAGGAARFHLTAPSTAFGSYLPTSGEEFPVRPGPPPPRGTRSPGA
jgi:hypothetical protein